MFEYAARLVRVIDGDTVEFDVDLGFSIWRRETFRLAGINTPELRSKDPVERERAKLATTTLEHLLVDQEVTIQTLKDRREKFGRYLCRIRAGDVDVNQELLTLGFAVPYMVGE